MELIAGRSLEAILRAGGPLDPERAAGICARVADALAAAHAAGIVHRDIKPANVMVAEDGAVKVLDFGIARALDATTLTQTSAVLGTAAYMSPEQALGKPVDQRSDIYSLGCVLCALLAGRPPFTGDSAAAIVNQHAHSQPPALPAQTSRVSPQLAALVARMLAKSPDDRPQTAVEVADRLAHAASSPSPTQSPTAPTAPTATAPLPVGPTNRRRLILAGATAAAILVVVLIALASSGNSPHTEAGKRHATSTRTTSKKRSHATSSATATSSTTTAATTTSTQPPRPRTVSGTAGALTALVTQDVQSGTIDQQAAQQITNALSDILNSYEMGHTQDIQHKLADLSQHLAMLEQHGDITAAAAPALNKALANFTAALASQPAPATNTPGSQPAAHPAGPPAHNKQQPDQAKHSPPGD